MAAYYNEIDPFAAQWLRELVKAGHIAPGDVDERSIEDVEPSELSGYTQCHFFAGIGVWSYALRNAGVSDREPVWTGSCPCQPFSSAGKGKGFADERHLWPAFHWLISQCRPVTVFGEQVAGKAGEAWLDVVSTDLEGEGYAVGSVVTAACGFGAPHQRRRMYWVGHAEGGRGRGPQHQDGGGDEGQAGAAGVPSHFWSDVDWLDFADGKRRCVEPGTFPMAHGSPDRVGRVRGYGNAIVAQQAQAFIEGAGCLKN